jgi:hypothetical protein
MTHSDFKQYLVELGWAVDTIVGGDSQTYMVIKGVNIYSGGLTGKSCDVAVQMNAGVPWVPQAAIHTRPFLVAAGSLSTKVSTIGPEWLYWSRRFDHALQPKAFMAHILTIINEVPN